tara:strand:- start:22501 stop:23157 length:657 start_codon:yes stop_codon:yes gene_type:complete
MKRADWIAAEWPAPKSVVAGTTLRGTRIEDLDLPGRLCWLEQVHGTNIVPATDYTTPPQADGSFSKDPLHACVVRTADCLPVLLCTDDGAAVAAVHAGWRGLAAGVIENAVAALGAREKQVMAWLGPAISQASFEVGAEVRDAFLDHDPGADSCFEPNSRGRWQADLYGLARQRLAALGIMRVYGGGFCTRQDSQRFDSYRRNPECGRIVSFIALPGA